MSWFRVQGEGTPYDHSAGASTEGDWTGPPVLRVVPSGVASASTPEPVEAPEAVLGPSGGFRTYTRPDGVRVTEPIPPQPPLTPVKGLRAYLAALRSVLDHEEHP